MNAHPDPRLMEAKAIPMSDLVHRLGISRLRPTGAELVGPCPLCGGRDRFGINLRSNAFLCRHCDLRGGDQVSLVQGILSLSFRDALTWLCGDAPASIDPAELERRQARARRSEQKHLAAQDEFRRKAIADAHAIWNRARPGQLGVVAAYLKARGITPEMLPTIPMALRFITDHAYVKRLGGQLVTMHRGPAMIAGILDADGNLGAVHQTWINSAPPHGKASIIWDGEAQASKLVRGSKKGGAIRLATPSGADTLVMGEGIETTLSAMVVAPVPNAAYWAGVDLGNISGRMARVAGQRYSGLPDMADDSAFVPPAWVRRLIFIQDGDSEPSMTRAKLLSGARRAMALRPGLRAQIVMAGEGVDLNDVLNKTDRPEDE